MKKYYRFIYYITVLLIVFVVSSCKDKAREINPEAVKAVMAMPEKPAIQKKNDFLTDMTRNGDYTPREHLKYKNAVVKGNNVISTYEFDDSEDMEDFFPEFQDRLTEGSLYGFSQPDNADLLKALIRTKTQFIFRMVGKKTHKSMSFTLTTEDLESCLQ